MIIEILDIFGVNITKLGHKCTIAKYSLKAFAGGPSGSRCCTKQQETIVCLRCHRSFSFFNPVTQVSFECCVK